MKRQKGYSFVEVLVAILIVIVLASIAIPIMRGRIDAAKWTEGKTMAGSIASAITVWSQGWAANNGDTRSWDKTTLGPEYLGFQARDLDGKHFDIDNFSWQVNFDGTTLSYVIRVSSGEGIWRPMVMKLDESGTWTELGTGDM